MNTRTSLFESSPTNRDSWVEDRTPDPSLFLSWPAQDQLLESVAHMMENTEDVTLLIGSHGAGKTTLIYRIQSQTQDHWLLCRVDANPMLQTDQLLQRLARRIGLNSGTASYQDDSSKKEGRGDTRNSEVEDDVEQNLPIPLGDAALTDVLHSSFGNLRLQGRLPVVLVDDADQLPTSTLQSLLRLHERTVEGLSPFALVLLAEPTIDSTLASRHPNVTGASNFQRLEIPRLTLEQIDGYILHFLRAEGVRNTPDWPMEQLITIHQEAGGLPGKVNELLKRALREGAVAAQQPSMWKKMLWLLAGVIGIGALGWGMLQFPVSTALLTTWFSNVAQQATQTGWISKNLPLPVPATTPDTASSNDPSGAASSPTHEPNATPTNADIAEAPLVRPLPLPAQTPTSASDILLSAPATVAPESSPDVAESASKRNDWVLQQPGTTYTLQLTMSSTETGAQRYIARNHIASQAFYVEIQRGNQTMYYVLYGTYSTRNAANAALAKLPSAVHHKKAWPRAFAKLQSELQGQH